MLQARLVARAVRIAKVEQAGADEGDDLLRARQLDAPHRAGLAVRDVEQRLLFVERQAHRLREHGFQARPILQPLDAISRKRLDDVAIEMQHEDLVLACHRDVEIAAREREVPGRTERGLSRRPLYRRVAYPGLLSRPGNSLYLSRGKIHAPNAVILSIGNVEHF